MAGAEVLIEAFDVETNVVARVGEVDARVVHLDSEDLARARIGRRMGRQEDNLLAGFHNDLLDAAVRISHILHWSAV